MKAAYLFFLIVAICAMVSQAAVHHYKVEDGGDHGHKKGGKYFITALPHLSQTFPSYESKGMDNKFCRFSAQAFS
ncbi:hypothetical protein CDAR_412291 [Caerostris darwini]|uniref:Uncharacterized protein n=1 Tax=Caerostris darwini TaxID=1538125 RepID=A0AAV4NRJ5_9ARAC|nr:hypothetical protein CDAR_412291 [Caerostris darwini]